MSAGADSYLEAGERLILVSNRLPVVLRRTADGLESEIAPGGLASGLSRPHQSSGGSWIGWPGITTDDGELSEEVQSTLTELGMKGVGLSEEEHERYYSRTSNRCIWPLFHYFTERVNFDAEDWDSYVAVNRKFADAVLEEASPGDLVFVQDFHLMLVPAMLRAARPDLRIGFFLHIPFPSSEVFRIFPKRREVLEGLLGADMVAFHTLDYVRNFRGSVRRVLGVETSTSEIYYGERQVQLLAQPLGIDSKSWQQAVEKNEVQEKIGRLIEAAGGRRIILGVERLDYTKGVPERLRAFRDLLARDHSLVERVMMIQIAVPSRVEVEEYRELKDEVDRIAGGINSEFGRPGLQPLHYQYRGVSPDTLAGMYLLADVAMVTPLRDGLNLVAKEFVASRIDDSGVLVLSEFTGAAWELGEALQVNPFDPQEMADTLEQALAMPPAEQARRMSAMRARVMKNDVHVWTENCLRAIRAGVQKSPPPHLDGSVLEQMGAAWEQASRRAAFLDYDGTLREFTQRPEDATPSAETLELLAKLAAQPNTDVWVVSGRSCDVLDSWLGETGVGMIAEHGAFVRRPDEADFGRLLGEPSLEWRESVIKIMQAFCDRVPGSLLEQKPLGLAWHYRASDPSLSTWQARELYQHLGEVLGGQGLEIMRGSKVIEVRPAAVNKASAVIAVLQERGADCLFAAGDDVTDETMFRALPASAVSVLIGERPSAARFRLSHPAALRDLLAGWARRIEALAASF